MSFRDLCQTDARSIISLDGEAIVLTSPPGDNQATYQLNVLDFHRGMTKDAEGMAVIGEARSITISLQALAEAGVNDPEALKANGWTATLGGSSYRLNAAPIDYTSGVVTLILKRSANA